MLGCLNISRFFGKGKKAKFSYSDNLLSLLSKKEASALRAELLEVTEKNKNFPREDFSRLASESSWPKIELEKLEVYLDFFLGNYQLAYQRLMANDLAKDDFSLYMTACAYCYLHSKFEEGYQLISHYDFSGNKDFAPNDFYPNAGFVAYVATGVVEDSIAYFDRATELSAPLVINSYMIYMAAGRYETLERMRRFVYSKCPNDQAAIYALALGELAKDFYPEGFRLAEGRYMMEGYERHANPFLLQRLRWQGETLKGKSIHIHGEQGLGDAIMMARYFPLLELMGARIIIDLQIPALTLLKHNFPNCEFVEIDIKNPVKIPCDYWTGLMSLPYHFSSTADSVPSCSGYLTVPQEVSMYWKGRVDSLAKRDALRVGVAWSGNPGHRYDRARSIDFSVFSVFLRTHAGVDFFTLQTNIPDCIPPNLINLSDEMLTLADTAALIQQMDLVITVDTSIVHLAGALGAKCWLLLPNRYEWRWSLEGEKNNWYDSVTVCRKSTRSTWGDLLSDLAPKLREIIIAADC